MIKGSYVKRKLLEEAPGCCTSVRRCSYEKRWGIWRLNILKEKVTVGALTRGNGTWVATRRMARDGSKVETFKDPNIDEVLEWLAPRI